jgi:hypothetical protein
VLSASICGGAYEPGGIVLTLELKDKEESEINLLG